MVSRPSPVLDAGKDGRPETLPQVPSGQRSKETEIEEHGVAPLPKPKRDGQDTGKAQDVAELKDYVRTFKIQIID